MVFSSVIFFWCFLPTVLIIYFIASFALKGFPKAAQYVKNAVLLLASLAFYALGGYKYILLLGAVLIINYLGGIFVHTFLEKRNAAKAFMILTVICDLLILFCFKYLNLFVMLSENIVFAVNEKAFAESWNNILTLKRTGAFDFATVILPIGISFYTFQSISYVADVYRKEAKVQKNFADFALYVSFFPQLIAGPIVKYSDIDTQIRSRRETVKLFADGAGRFIYGLAKKVLIANTMAEVADSIWGLEGGGIGAGIAWLGAVSYTLQIYFDFSGYSDMAIGLGKMFGFEFKENFNYPYISTSVQEFWRRWHISLSTWFKEYVYIPLGGSRCSMGKTVRNIFIVFLLTGIWHGANFTFLLWGIMYALFLIIERLFLGKILKKKYIKPIGFVYTLFVVIIGWVLFRSGDILQAFSFIGEMFSKGAGEYSILSFISMRFAIALVFGIVLSTPIYPAIKKKVLKNETVAGILGFFETVWQIVLLILSILVVVSGSYNPFIYFQF